MYKKPDLTLLFSILILTFISLFGIYSSSRTAPHFFYKQLAFVLISIFLTSLISKVDIYLLKYPYVLTILLAINILLLVGLFIFGANINGTHRWYSIFGFSIQPAEFTKYLLIIIVSGLLTNETLSVKTMFLIILPLLLVNYLLIFLQPDNGTVIMNVFVIGIIFLTWAIERFSLFKILISSISTIAVLLLIATFMWKANLLPNYVKVRVYPFISKSSKKEEHLHIRNSKIAIGSGGFWGKGMLAGDQSRLHFLPEYRTDFIYATICEEQGLFVGLIIFIAYALLLFRIYAISLTVEDEFLKLISLGILVKLWIEFFVNLGMELGLTPAKGVALPFLSYGGSSTIANFIAIGLILNMNNIVASSKDSSRLNIRL